MKKKNSRGFFFVLITLLLLIYIVGSISLIVRFIEISEKSASDRFKVSNIAAAVDQVTQEKMQKLAYITVKGAVIQLNTYSIDNPLKQGDSAKDELEFKYINDSMYGLVFNGTADGNNFVTGKELKISEKASLKGWANEFNKSLSKVGLLLQSFTIENFSINQTIYSAVDYSFNIYLTVKSIDGTVLLKRSHQLNGSVQFSGMIDPAIKREGKKRAEDLNLPDLNIEKQFFFHDWYDSPSSLEPYELQIKGSAGQGWFYGPIVSIKNADLVAEKNRSKYILYGTYSEIKSLVGENDYNQFHAYILTNKPTLDNCGNEEDTFNAIKYDSDCKKVIDIENILENPFVVIEGFTDDQLGDESIDCPEGQEGKCILFIADYDYSKIKDEPIKKNSAVAIYGIEALRDYTICGYYVNSDKAPSYFQRLMDKSFEKSSPFGIETFLVGQFIGGSGFDEYGVEIITYWSDEYSRLDRELFKDIQTDQNAIVRGMPGCKNAETCSSTESFVGHFRLGKDGKEAYLDEKDITCGNGKAGCR